MITYHPPPLSQPVLSFSLDFTPSAWALPRFESICDRVQPTTYSVRQRCSHHVASVRLDSTCDRVCRTAYFIGHLHYLMSLAAVACFESTYDRVRLRAFSICQRSLSSLLVAPICRQIFFLRHIVFPFMLYPTPLSIIGAQVYIQSRPASLGAFFSGTGMISEYNCESFSSFLVCLTSQYLVFHAQAKMGLSESFWSGGVPYYGTCQLFVPHTTFDLCGYCVYVKS
jgi:hypothetical protein